jgi:hypothetical protein
VTVEARRAYTKTNSLWFKRMFLKTTAIAKLFVPQTPLLGYTFFQKVTTSYHGILHEATIKAIKSVHISQPSIAKYIISF